jgi:protein ImuB
MVEKILDRMKAASITVRIALADTWGAAHALARFYDHPAVVAPPGEGTKAILDLPIAALRLPADIVDGLRVLGFVSIGELAAKPRAPLALRFGPELGRRIDQALGRIGEPIEPIRPAEIIEVRHPFAEPIGAAETIAKYIEQLVIELCKTLEAKGLGAKRLDLLLYRVDNQIEVIRIGTALPLRNVKRLTRMLVDKVETVDPGFGIEVMTLTATMAEPLDLTQAISSLIDEPEADVAALIDTLTNRIGENALYRFAPVASDVPERSVQRVAPMSPDDGQSWPAHWPRPTRLLAHPEQIETVALLPDHPPVAFTWRGIRRRVKRADGPERVFGEWWKRDAELIAVRDYFQVDDEAGERFWIYRAGDGEDTGTGSHRWFLHGIFG